MIEAAGEASQINIHWCALDVARFKRFAEPVLVAPGQVLRFDWIEPVWLVQGYGTSRCRR